MVEYHEMFGDRFNRFLAVKSKTITAGLRKKRWSAVVHFVTSVSTNKQAVKNKDEQIKMTRTFLFIHKCGSDFRPKYILIIYTEKYIGMLRYTITDTQITKFVKCFLNWYLYT